jgi:hypothetical protein
VLGDILLQFFRLEETAAAYKFRDPSCIYIYITPVAYIYIYI